jgi:hypothetical protein
VNGKRVIRNIGIHYQDDYVRENGKWLFAKRTTIFDGKPGRNLPLKADLKKYRE